MNILITGGSGFIGSHLFDALGDENNVASLTLSQYGYMASNDLEFKSLVVPNASKLTTVLSQFDLVIHCAGYNGRAVSPSLELSNIKHDISVTYDLVEAAIQTNLKTFILLSTGSMYESVNANLSRELDRINVDSPYKAAMFLKENYLHRRIQNTKLNGSVVRLFNVYGPGQTSSTIITKLIYEALIGRRLVRGDLDIFRDFIFIDDVIQFFKLYLRKEKSSSKKFEIFNLGTSCATSIRSIRRFMRYGVLYEKLASVRKHAFRNYLAADISRAQCVLGWSPATRLDNGLLITREWYSENLSILLNLFEN